MEDIDMSKVCFTEHAVRRFYDRYKAVTQEDLKEPEKTARNILAKAREDHTLDGPARVRRLIDNGFQEVKYFFNSGWRFVIKDEDDRLTVLTVEFNDGRYERRNRRR